jgi:hypothetical protein
MGVAGFLSATYVLLADRADTEDQALAAAGETPHKRADLDRLVGLTVDEEEPPAETNIVELAAWVARNNG